MGNAPVFGRRGVGDVERPLPRLADLPPAEPSLDEDLGTWKQTRKLTLRENHRRWLYGGGGLGALLILGSTLLRLFDQDIVALLLSAAGLYCFYRGYRASKS